MPLTDLADSSQWFMQGIGPVGPIHWDGLALDLVSPPAENHDE
jgi:hypothetical protein